MTSIPNRKDRQCPRGKPNETRTAALGHHGSVLRKMRKGEEPQQKQKEIATFLTSEAYYDGVHECSQVGHIQMSSIRPELGLQEAW